LEKGLLLRIELRSKIGVFIDAYTCTWTGTSNPIKGGIEKRK